MEKRKNDDVVSVEKNENPKNDEKKKEVRITGKVLALSLLLRMKRGRK
jgi:hypothetical protein